MQTAVLAMGIGEGGRAGIAIDDADAGESGDVRLRSASATCEADFRTESDCDSVFVSQAAGSEK